MKIIVQQDPGSGDVGKVRPSTSDPELFALCNLHPSKHLNLVAKFLQFVEMYRRFKKLAYEGMLALYG